jgi:hypothetical protein
MCDRRTRFLAPEPQSTVPYNIGYRKQYPLVRELDPVALYSSTPRNCGLLATSLQTVFAAAERYKVRAMRGIIDAHAALFVAVRLVCYR